MQTLVQIRCGRVEEKKRLEYFILLYFKCFQHYKEIVTVATNSVNLLLSHKFSMLSVNLDFSTPISWVLHNKVDAQQHTKVYYIELVANCLHFVVLCASTPSVTELAF